MQRVCASLVVLGLFCALSGTSRAATKCNDVPGNDRDGNLAERLAYYDCMYNRSKHFHLGTDQYNQPALQFVDVNVHIHADGAAGAGNLSVGNTNTFAGATNGFVTGVSNEIHADSNVMIGGWVNSAVGDYSAVCGGHDNLAHGYSVTLIGGAFNSADGDYCTVGGGFDNTCDGYMSTISGGSFNEDYGEYSAIIGGSNNRVLKGSYGVTIAGGTGHTGQGWDSTICGGNGNVARGSGDAIAGGFFNQTEGFFNTVGGGNAGQAYSPAGLSAVFGGEGSLADKQYATTVGGYNNIANGIYATICGGYLNWIERYADRATVTGGYYNHAGRDLSEQGEPLYLLAPHSAMCGGQMNRALSDFAVVSGGHGNWVYGDYGTISGGKNRRIYSFEPDHWRAAIYGCSN